MGNSTVSEPDAAWRDRYLALLGLAPKPPSAEALRSITSAHRRIVFENLTSLTRYAANRDRPMPPLDTETLLKAWEDGCGGGVCYEQTAMVHRLLSSLGYEVQAILAKITSPFSHQAVVVSLDGVDVLVDVGNGAPLWDPYPLAETTEVRHAGLRYQFREDSGAFVQDRWIGSKWQPFARYNLAPASATEREAAFQWHHTPGGPSFVLNSFRLVRCEQSRLLSLADHELSVYTNTGKTTEEVYGPNRYREVVADLFGLPAAPVEAALTAWSELTGTSI